MEEKVGGREKKGEGIREEEWAEGREKEGEGGREDGRR